MSLVFIGFSSDAKIQHLSLDFRWNFWGENFQSYAVLIYFFSSFFYFLWPSECHAQATGGLRPVVFPSCVNLMLFKRKNENPFIFIVMSGSYGALGGGGLVAYSSQHICTWSQEVCGGQKSGGGPACPRSPPVFSRGSVGRVCSLTCEAPALTPLPVMWSCDDQVNRLSPAKPNQSC